MTIDNWEVDTLIHARQQQEGCGAGVIPALAHDLHNELPEEKGFSKRNINRMLAFYREYPHLPFVPQPVTQLNAGPKVPPSVALFPAKLIQSIPWTTFSRAALSTLLAPTTRS